MAESVRLRRKADLQNSIRRVTPGSLRHHLACVGVIAAADDDLTVLEVTVHTRALQVRPASPFALCFAPTDHAVTNVRLQGPAQCVGGD